MQISVYIYMYREEKEKKYIGSDWPLRILFRGVEAFGRKPGAPCAIGSRQPNVVHAWISKLSQTMAHGL